MNDSLGRSRAAWPRRLRSCASAVALGTLLVGVPAPADEQGITVTGTGETLAAPDSLEIDIGASGSAELTADAIVKYRERLRRVTEAFKKLDIKQLQLQQRELSIGNLADEQHPHPRVTIARAMRIVVAGIRQMPEDELLSTVGQLIDAAKDAGGADEEAQSRVFAVRFALQDPKTLRQQACQKAFENAKEQACRLAQLAGGKLGQVMSVSDMSAAADYAAVTEVIYGIYGRDEEQELDEQGRIVAASLKEIPVRVSLRVRFELLPGPPGQASAEAAHAVVEK
ncbi:MAG TPA: SIMPL domain-containing protein [Pirellulales bacterium]|nr:SIMPL domain-containing protein [Pirellulales bacterium]